MRLFHALLLIVLLIVACYESHFPEDTGADSDGGAVTCPMDRRVQCVTTPDNPCERRQRAAPLCLDSGWMCPEGSEEYRRAASAPTCTPFAGIIEEGVVGESGPSLATEDRCGWVFDRDTFFDDIVNQTLVVPDDPAPFGGCPDTREFVRGAPLAAERPPGRVHSIIHSFVAGPETLVILREFRRSDAAIFGVVEVATGFARWRPETRSLEIFGYPTWTAPRTFGDILIRDDTGTFAASCGGDELVLDCTLATVFANNISAGSIWRHWDGTEFGPDTADAPRVFPSGPHRSDIVRLETTPATYAHVYIEGFARELLVHFAPAIQGPWSEPEVLAECELPSESSFCSSPLIREELLDPMRPLELAVSYNVGTTEFSDVETSPPGSIWPRVTYATVSPR